MTSRELHLRVDAVIVAVTDEVPRVLVVPGSEPAELPCGALEVDDDRTLELALRRIVGDQTGIDLGYVEQLYTFGDEDRVEGRRLISIAYLALVREEQTGSASERCAWRDLYALLPWEDHRERRPGLLEEVIAPAIERWAGEDDDRRTRAAITFGLDGASWDPTRALERFELLYEVGLVAERSGAASTAALGLPLALDHRRMAATALGRVRGKLSYRPVVFELLPAAFTLSSLQRVVEALAGVRLHTPNFRRLLDRTRLVCGTGELVASPRGRPAELHRFRPEVLRERPSPGVGLPTR